MDWPLRSPHFDKRDLEDVFDYQPRPSRAVRVSNIRKVNKRDTCPTGLPLESVCEPIEVELESEYQWMEWCDNYLSASKGLQSGLHVILASRSTDDPDNSSALEDLPFSRSTFSRITEVLPLHGDIARIINRSDVPYFGDIDHTDNCSDFVFYCCRTSSSLPGDLAISSVFNHATGSVAAMVFGCTDDITEKIAARIENSEDSSAHPMLIFGILAELERERHTDVVRDRVFHLLARVHEISRGDAISVNSSFHQETYSVDLWIKVSQLRDALKAWKGQLYNMVEHIDSLERQWLQGSGEDLDFGKRLSPGSSTAFIKTKDTVEERVPRQDSWQSTSTLVDEDDAKLSPSSGRKGTTILAGRRIKKRLREILCDYDQKIRECTMVLDGMSLSTQLSWNHIGYQDTQTNIRIANSTKQDSSQMKSIAFLTMIFLPATFVASLFSMSFFDWHPSPGDPIFSPYIWIYVVLAACITVVVLISWWLFNRRRKDKTDNNAV